MRVPIAVIAALALYGGLAIRSEARVVYVNRAANGASNGFSWQSAYTSIQAGVNSAASGDEVWVATGTYVENVQLRSNVALYGGFDGTESSRQQRNPAVHFTSIDGGGKGSCASFPFGAGPQTILDGFRLRNGRDDNGGGGGGGIFVSNRVTGIISNNVITENHAGQGGGIAVQYASVTIANNLIEGNSGFGAAIVAYSDEPRDPSRDAPKIVNNTIVNHQSEDGGSEVAVYLSHLAGAVFANNIVSRNDFGVSIGDNTDILIENNDVADNRYGDWLGSLGNPAGNDGNIGDDPLFADVDSLNFSITPDSPAVGAGANDRAVGEWDLDHGPRIRDDQVDIGAYESDDSLYRLVFSTQPAGGEPGASFEEPPVVYVEDAWGGIASDFYGEITLSIDPGSGSPDANLEGTVTVSAEGGVAAFPDIWVTEGGKGFVLNATADDLLPAQSRMFSVGLPRVYVRTDGSDDDDGLSWDTAKATVQAALDMRPLEIWVAEGTYTENVEVLNAVAMYGGFEVGEEDLSARDPEARSVLDGSNEGTVLTSRAQEGPGLALLDGFTLTNGSATGDNGGGAFLAAFRGTIANVEFSNNTAGNAGGGLYLESRNNAGETNITLTNVAFRHNTSGMGGGLYVDTNENNAAGTTVHLSNTLFEGNVAAWGGGAYLTGRDMEFKDGAAFTDNVATLGGGMYVNASTTLLTGLFQRNGTSNAPADAGGGGVYVDGGGYLNASNVLFEDNALTAPGFAARGGAVAAENGGGLYLYAATMTGNAAETGGAIYTGPRSNVSLSHLTLSGNSARGSGGGAYLRGSGVYIETSLIAGNTAGAASPSAFGGGLVLDHAPLYQFPTSPAVILNVTIAGNQAPAGGGLEMRGSSLARLTNTIVAFNTSGIRMDASSHAAFYNNDVFGNTPGGDFQGFTAPTGTLGNIAQDPLFVNRASGNYRLQAGSPAIDTGDSGEFTWYHRDLGNQPRVQGARVDMGAYESPGAASLFLQWDRQPVPGNGPGALATQPRLRIVDASGNTRTDDIGAVSVSIKPGTGTTGAVLNVTTTVFANAGVATFTDLTLNKGGTGYILTAKAAETGPSDSNAFNVTLPRMHVAPGGNDANDGGSWAAPKRTLQAAADGAARGGGVWIAAGTYTGAVQIRGTSLFGGFAGTETDPDQRAASAGATILDADHLAEALNVQSNEGFPLTFDGLTLQNAVSSGAVAFADNLTFSNDTFRNNTAGFGAGMLSFGNNVRITRSRFLNNVAQWGGGGVYLAGGNNAVHSSLFAGNSDTYGGAAIDAFAGDTITIANNTLTGNTGGRGTIQLNTTPATLINNIIANNAAGVTRSQNASSTLLLSHNDVFGNAAFNYENLSAGATDISADPLFANAAGGDYRLANGSPAVDAGDDVVLAFVTLDLAGNPRKAGAHVDIGALEHVAGVPGLQDAIRALQIAAGFHAATPGDMERLNVDDATASHGVVDLRDAARLTRQAIGAGPTP